jgi:beta-lactamase regulating signal transducer with metallopeptidase domain
LYLLNVVSAAVLAAAAALLACRLARRASASVRHALLVVGLFLILGSPTLVCLAQRLELGLLHLETPAAPMPPAEEDLPLFVEMREPNVEAALPWPEAGEAVEEPPTTAPTEPGLSVWTRTGISLAALWAAGAAWGLGRLFHGFRRVRGLARSFRVCTDLEVQIVAERAASRVGLLRIPEIGSSPLVPVPLVVGLGRPRVILPESLLEELPPAELEAILLHEFAHVVRRDPWVALAQRLAGALFWWCPLVHRLNRRLGELREDLCDNFVLQHQGGRAFARLLVELAERLVAARALAGTVGLLEPAHGGLEGRIRRLLHKERDTMTTLTARGKGLAALFLVLTAGLLTAANVLAQEKTDKPKIVIIGEAGDAKQPTALNPKEIEELLRTLEKQHPEAAAHLRKALQASTPADKVEIQWKVAPGAGADTTDAQLKDLLKRLEALKLGERREEVIKIVRQAEEGPQIKITRQAPPGKTDPRIEDLVKQAEAIKPGSGAAIRKILEQQEAHLFWKEKGTQEQLDAARKALELKLAEAKKREAEIEALIKQAEAIKPGSGAELRKLLTAQPKGGWEVVGPDKVRVVPVVPPPTGTTGGKPATGDQREQLKKEIERTIKQLEELRRQLDERKP